MHQLRGRDEKVCGSSSYMHVHTYTIAEGQKGSIIWRRREEKVITEYKEK